MAARTAQLASSVVGLAAFSLLALSGAGCGNIEHGPSGQSQSECATCHLDEYEATTAPPHAGTCGAEAYAFATTCDDCHDKTLPDWWPTTTDHNWWPLTGQHATASCEQCHGTGGAPDSGAPANWACLSSNCYGCHSNDCAGAVLAAPSHPVCAASTDCQSCHSTNDWQLQHPEQAFPIQSGPHGGKDCADCHDSSLGSSIDGANTVCTGCHPLGEMDPKHDEVGSYFTFRSNPGGPHFCLECHPDGRNRGD